MPTTSPKIRTLTANDWPDWYANSNAFQVAGTAFRHLLPALLVAGAAGAVGHLLVGILCNLESLLRHSFLVIVAQLGLLIVYGVILGTVVTGISGILALLAVTLFDQSLGKVMSPIWFCAASIGLTQIPLAVMSILLHAFSEYPDSAWFDYCYFIGSIAVGSAIGIWGGTSQIASSRVSPRSRSVFNIWQLPPLIGWIGLLLVVGIRDPFFGGVFGIYLLTVTTVVVAYSLGTIRRRTTTRNDI